MTFGIVIVAVETIASRLLFPRLLGAVLGAALGFMVGCIALLALAHFPLNDSGTDRFLALAILLSLTYTGLSIGANSESLPQFESFSNAGGKSQRDQTRKVLDTSVIIDGRIADIADTGFLDGALIIPQFVCASCRPWPIRPTP